MNIGRVIGLAALIVGLALVGLAYHFSEAPVDQISNTLTGHYTDNTMWYLMGGIIVAASGAALTVFGKTA